MAHNLRIRPDPKWTVGTPWTSGEQAQLDAALVAAVNGDEGGDWASTGNTLLGGAGIRFIATTHTLSGVSSAVATAFGSSEEITHGDSDYIEFDAGHAGLTADLRSPIADARWSAGWSEGHNAFGEVAHFALVSAATGASARVPLRVHNGATFAGVTFSFSVHAAVAIPTVLPAFGVFARDRFGNVTPLSAYYSPTPHTLSDWQSGESVQTYPVMLLAPSVVIDTSRFSYFLEIVEASGPRMGPHSVTYFDPILHFTSILDLRPR